MGPPPGPRFRINFETPIKLRLRFVYDRSSSAREPPSCGDAADSDDDGQVGISDPLYTLYFLFLNGPPPPRPFPSRGKDPTRDELPCASDAGLVWIPAPTPLAYDLTFMHRADGVIYETEEESVTFDFQHSEKVLAQGDSFARFGQRFDFDPLRLIVPNEDNSWAPGSALWFVLPGGNANPEPGVTMQTVYPEELEPGVVVIQDVADYTIQSVSGHIFLYLGNHCMNRLRNRSFVGPILG